MDKLTVLCVSDNNYLPHLYSLLNSLEKNTTCIDTAIIYLVNVDLAHVTFNKYRFKLDIHCENVSYDTTKNKLTRYSCGLLNGRYMSDHHAYCNNLRYLVIPDILKNIKTPLLYIDVDNIIRKDLIEFTQELNNFDISIFKYPLGLHPIGWRKFMTYACGIIGINPTKESVSFFEDMKSEVSNNDILTVGDQLDFYNVWLKHKDTVRINKFDKKYKDCDLYEDSFIWSGDGTVKDEMLFKKCMENYK